MQPYIVRRALTLFMTIWLTASISFFTLLVLPGNPARLILGTDANPTALSALEEQMGLNEPAIVRYGRWLVDALRFDWGSSIVYHIPVTRLIGERLQVTLPLAGMALLLTAAIGIPL